MIMVQCHCLPLKSLSEYSFYVGDIFLLYIFQAIEGATEAYLS